MASSPGRDPARAPPGHELHYALGFSDFSGTFRLRKVSGLGPSLSAHVAFQLLSRLYPKSPNSKPLVLLLRLSGKVEFGTAVGVPDEAGPSRAVRLSDFGEAFAKVCGVQGQFSFQVPGFRSLRLRVAIWGWG